MQLIWDGLFVGSFYALIALGYSMVYGIIKLLNFAHGDLVTLGGLIAFTAVRTWGLPLWSAIIIATAGGMVAGWLLDAGIFAPLRRRGGCVPSSAPSVRRGAPRPCRPRAVLRPVARRRVRVPRHSGSTAFRKAHHMCASKGGVCTGPPTGPAGRGSAVLPR